MEEQPKAKKFWNPGLDSDEKLEQNESQNKPTQPQMMMNPLVNYLHMFSLIQQQHQQNKSIKSHQQIPPFLQLLNSNGALNKGIHSNKSTKESKKPIKVQIKPKIDPTNSQNSSQAVKNPIVDSVLNSNNSVNYNCCAICGISFRLTTDLVAHMRNNHRQSRYKRKLPSEDN